MSIDKTTVMTFKFLPILALAGVLGLQSLAQCIDPFALVNTTGVVCSNRPFQLDATNYPGATYTWVGPPGSGIAGPGTSTLNIPNAQVVANSGIYTVTMTYGPCVYTQSINIFVEKTPDIANVTYQSPICPKATETITIIAANPTGTTYYGAGPAGWTFTSTSTNVATIPNMTQANGGIYTVYVQNTAGCKSDPHTFNINVYPDVVAGFTPDIKLGCEHDSVVFNNTSTGNVSNEWTFGDGTGSSDISPLHIYNTQGTFNVTLIAGNGTCFDTTKAQVNFNHSIKAGFTVDDDSICQGSTINFTNTSAYFPAILPKYEWNFKDGGTDNVLNPSHLYARTGEYLATLIATDNLGCKDSAKHLIVVDSAGSISFTPSEDVICAGKTISFKGTFMQVGNTSTVWDMADGNVIKDRDDIVYTYDRAGTYNVTFTANYRICPSAVFSKDIIIKPYPKINLGPDSSICPNGNPLVLRDRINEANPAAKWNWNTSDGDHNSYIDVRHPGTFSATVDVDGCSATDTVVVTSNCYINIPNAFTPDNDGIDDYFLPRQLLSKGIDGFKMTIFNRWGQVIFSTTSADGRGWDGSFNGKPQPVGVYIYLVEASFINGAREHYQGNVTLLR